MRAMKKIIHLVTVKSRYDVTCEYSSRWLYHHGQQLGSVRNFIGLGCLTDEEEEQECTKRSEWTCPRVHKYRCFIENQQLILTLNKIDSKIIHFFFLFSSISNFFAGPFNSECTKSDGDTLYNGFKTIYYISDFYMAVVVFIKIISITYFFFL